MGNTAVLNNRRTTGMLTQIDKGYTQVYLPEMQVQ